MRQLQIILTLLMILVFIVGSIGCSTSEEDTPTPTPSPTPTTELSSPEEVVERYMIAFAQLDIEGVAQCFTEDQRAEIRSWGQDIDSIEIWNISTTLISETAYKAVVELEYDWQVTAYGDTGYGHERETIELIKENGMWLVEAVIVPDTTAAIALETDMEVMQLAAATFYSDVHAGFNGINHTWCDSALADAIGGHYYPTSFGVVSEHVLVENYDQYDSYLNPRMDIDESGIAASDEDIANHAIWMGLLVNGTGDFTPIPGGSNDRNAVSPLKDEYSLYLSCIADSSSTLNGAIPPGGTYTWVVGKEGYVFAAYKSGDGHWYSGFNGSYP